MKYKLVCFDLDGTLLDFTHSIWQTLHDYFETDVEVRRAAIDRFMKGEITYTEWAEHDVDLFKKKNATKEDFITAIRTLQLMPGAREALSELKSRGFKLAVLSGSINLVLDELFPDHPFDDVYINELHFDAEGGLQSVKSAFGSKEHKNILMQEIAEREGIPLSECVFVGDGNNDVEAAEAAGLSIAFNARSETLMQVCNVVIPPEIRDVRAILPHILEE
ncbi:HAD family phosphatase [Candidatus Woesearchaeota archaeon]|nr:HAD family phosphatase [Candidatus Woesearchaeota archaeon]